MKADPIRVNTRSGGVAMTVLSTSSAPLIAANTRQKIRNRMPTTKRNMESNASNMTTTSITRLI
nr:MAG TPA: hypothetical protein [Caudoviricetes sp.]